MKVQTSLISLNIGHQWFEFLVGYWVALKSQALELDNLHFRFMNMDTDIRDKEY